MNKQNDNFKDPSPALNGPPTRTISGVVFQSPSVDNPNIKLQSQNVKNLTASSITDVLSKSNTVTDTNIQIDGKNQSMFVSDGLGNRWSPNKFDPSIVTSDNFSINTKNDEIIPKINSRSQKYNNPRIKTVKILKSNNVVGI